jgi:serine/threonine-protein kinase HipA
MASLFVYMNGYEVGEYIQHKSGAQEFIYSDSWLDRGSGAIPLSLSLPLTESKHKGDSVCHYFENLLPDSKNIRERIQARLGVKTDKPFDLLSAIGKDCVGAIQLMTERTDVEVRKIEGIPVNDSEIADELKNYRTLPLGMSKDREFRISLAGAQEKTALLWHDEKWNIPRSTTPTTHILKLPIGKIEHSGIDLSDSVENEWLCMEILRTFGLPVPNVRIEKFEDIKVLVVERFDRELSADKAWIIRLPQEDMCQSNSIAPGLKYESDGGPGISIIMDLLNSSLQPEEDRRQFMQTIFIFWMLGAIDGHAKNFSIFLKQGGRFQLTPVYDVISAYPVAEKREIEYREIKMAMALHSKNIHYHWSNLLPGHWFAQSKGIDFPVVTMQQIIEDTVGALDKVIIDVSSRLPPGFPEHIAHPIFNNMKMVTRKLI